MKKALLLISEFDLPLPKKIIILMLLATFGEKVSEFSNFVEKEYFNSIKKNDVLEEHVLSVYFYVNQKNIIDEKFISKIRNHKLLKNNTRISYSVAMYYQENKNWNKVINVFENYINISQKYHVTTDFTADLICAAGIAYICTNELKKGSKLLRNGISSLLSLNKIPHIHAHLKTAEENNINIDEFKKMIGE